MNYFNNFSSNSYSKFLKKEKKIASLASDLFLDNDFFRRTISFHYQNIYLTRKRINKTQQIVFFGLSAIFLFLTVCIFFKTTNYTCGLYFGECNIIKECVDGFCLLFSIMTFGLGFFTHPDKEAINFLVKKVERDLNKASHHIRVELSQIFKRLFSEQVQLEFQTI